MKKLITPLFCLTLTVALTLAVTASARSTHIPDEYPTTGKSTRALGMGNAFLTMPGSDEAALYYNPASLNDLKKDTRTAVSIPAFPAEFNYKIISTIKDVFNLKDDLKDSTTKSGDVDVFNKFVDKHIGEVNHVAVTFPYVNVYRHNWGVGLIGDSRTTISLRDQSISNFEIRSVNDAGVVLGGAYGFIFDDLQIGARIKFLERVELDRIVTVNDIQVNDDLGKILGWKKWQKGFGVGGDLGLKYTVPFLLLKPTVAVAYNNIGKLRFKGHPNDVDQSVDAAIGIHPTFGETGLSVEAGATGINQKKDYMNKLHAGAELRLPRFAATQLSIRGGMNQGYAAAGLTLDWSWIKFVAAFYGEETGEFRHSKASYRYAGDLMFTF